jgi:hypothetical protein
MQSIFEYRGRRLRAITVRRGGGWSSEFSVDGRPSQSLDYTMLDDESAALAEGEDRARKHVDLEYT